MIPSSEGQGQVKKNNQPTWDITASGGGMAITRLGGFLLFKRLSVRPWYGGGSSPSFDAILSECWS